jgi:hypothetical protein
MFQRKPKPKPNSEPMTDAEFERLIQAHLIRGWKIASRSGDTVQLVTPLHRARKTLTPYSQDQLWLTKRERRLLGED